MPSSGEINNVPAFLFQGNRFEFSKNVYIDLWSRSLYLHYPSIRMTLIFSLIVSVKIDFVWSVKVAIVPLGDTFQVISLKKKLNGQFY